MTTPIIYSIKDSPNTKFSKGNEFAKEEKKVFITNFKAITALLTLFCILAVDFRLFPRELAKTENYGLSLMDLGVGAVIFSMGLTSGRFWQQPDYFTKVFKSSIVTFLIGLGRLVVIKIIGYHEHESEYGRHWNFFLTLAIVPVLVAVFKKLFQTSRFLLISAVIEAAKTYCNHRCQSEEYIMSSGSRFDLLNQNREGVYSALGYLSIYLVSAYIGKGIYKYKTPAQWRRYSFLLTLITFLSTAIAGFCWYITGYAPSRRCANTPYVLWIIAICGWQLLSLYSYEWHFGHAALNSPLLQSISKHQLGLFMIANVLTGIINIKFKTLLMNSWQTALLLSSYLLLLFWIGKKLDKFSF